MGPQRCSRGEGAVAGTALQRRLLQPMRRLVDPQLSQEAELLAALVALQQLVRVTLLRLPQLVALLVFEQHVRLVEAFVAGVAGEGLAVAGHVFGQLVVLVEAFVAEFAEEALLLVELPPPPALLLFLLLRARSCTHTHRFWDRF